MLDLIGSYIKCINFWGFQGIFRIFEQSHEKRRWDLDLFDLVVYTRQSMIFILSESLIFFLSLRNLLRQNGSIDYIPLKV